MEEDFVFFMAIVYGFVAVIFSFYFYKRVLKVSEKKITRKSEKKLKFFRAIVHGLERDLIKTLKDMENHYDGIFEIDIGSEDFEEELEFYNLLDLLKEFLVELTVNNRVIFKKPLKSESVSKFNDKINCFINEIEETNVEFDDFEGLPDLDRTLLEDIKTFIENDMKTTALKKIDDFGNLLYEKNDDISNLRWELDDTKRTVRNSIIIALLSIGVTIVVGLIGLMI